ncbi:branched-chain amino acid transport system permease protein [Amaricoccus macauensis]|uniref:Branched-chain amino acid transport system permease protein n=1 Tax=Amaricoccus macauensis TaxID=57001 RepID=A0A840SIJ7_9RHOB|nr:branched-chain amino acid ABC transporter permease [Amaricoccus macauensis]MBB5221697.1 branched-chain amino acid transport system permease protein [Amaricoccus macauensis]
MATATDPAPTRGEKRVLGPFLLIFAPLAAVLFVAIPFVLADMPYWLNVVTNACLLSFASLGVWLTFSIGRVNIAQGAFCLIGGYTVGGLTTFGGLSFWLALPFGGAAAALVGYIIGYPLLRLRGIYFAMVTLSLTEAVRLAFLYFGTMVGVTSITSIPSPPGITSPMAFYLFAAALLILGYAGIWRLQSSRTGGVFRSMRQNEELAASIGIDVARYRVFAFTICCFMGGIAGGIFAALQQNVYPQSYTVADSINFMLYCFLGGLEFVLGPIVGTFALVVSFELLRAIQEYQALLYGILMIVVMLFLPNGLLSFFPALKRLSGGRK